MSGSWLLCFPPCDGWQHGLIAYFHHFVITFCGRNAVKTKGVALLMDFASSPRTKLVVFIQGVLHGSNQVDHHNQSEQVVWHVGRARTQCGIATLDRSRLRGTVSEFNGQNGWIALHHSSATWCI